MTQPGQRNVKAHQRQGGAYTLHIELRRPARLSVGALGECRLKPGCYVYVGSARRGIAARVARHEKLARTKTGTAHWHIDYLLLHFRSQLVRVEVLADAEECVVARAISGGSGVEVPFPGFGSSDCRSGCRAHLFFRGGVRS